MSYIVYVAGSGYIRIIAKNRRPSFDDREESCALCGVRLTEDNASAQVIIRHRETIERPICVRC